MDQRRSTTRYDVRCLAAAALAAMIAIQVEVASRVTMDAVRTSAAIAARVVSPPAHARVPLGVSIALATVALSLISLARSLTNGGRFVDRRTAVQQISINARLSWRSRLIRAARSGGALDR